VAKSKVYRETEAALARHARPACDVFAPADARAVEPFCRAYRAFLDGAKTERLAVRRIAEAAARTGFRQPAKRAKGGKYLSAYREKAAALAMLGKQPVAHGVNLIVSHLDSPRLDLKQNPLFEEWDVALFKTHYYGALRKHQWVARPLALYGVVVKGDGQVVELALGDQPDDPCFTINDLLPHLSHNVQNSKKLAEAIPAEKLNVTVGGRSIGGPEDGRNRIKLGVLRELHRRFGLVEEDFISAELELVPAGPAREVGLDGAFIGAYGQDDRLGAYTSLRAVCDLTAKPARSAVVLFLDKEEIGSQGNTGAAGRFLLDFLGELLDREGPADERAIHRALAASQVLCADVIAAVDPAWPEVHDKYNAARLGHGVALVKATGSRGKAGASDAHAEFVGKIRRLLNEADIPWQTGTMGKVDEGSSNTVAKFFAAYGPDVLDIGPALLSVHSPFELAHKDDIYATYLALKSFLAHA